MRQNYFREARLRLVLRVMGMQTSCIMMMHRLDARRHSPAQMRADALPAGLTSIVLNRFI